MSLQLRLHGESFSIPRKTVIQTSGLFDAHPDLYDETSYNVESEVDVDDCQAFVDFLQTDDDSLITSDNRRSLQALADEFGATRLIELVSEVEAAEFSDTLFEQMSDLTDSVSQQVQITESVERDFPRSLCEFLGAQVLALSEQIRALRQQTDDRFLRLEEEIRALREDTGDRFSGLSKEVGALRKETEVQTTGIDERISGVQASIRGLTKTLELHHLNFSKPVQCPMKEAKSRDGIISYLTKKHGGNVDDKKIVRISAKTVKDKAHCGPRNIAEFTDNSDRESKFWSNNEPDQWVCWDFREMLVKPTHYTIRASCLKSWVIEGSLDGRNWKEIDRQMDTQHFNTAVLAKPMTASFSASHPVKCRFIRLTQIGERHMGNYLLDLREVEFFGTLSE
jgi:hypothetical protein